MKWFYLKKAGSLFFAGLVFLDLRLMGVWLLILPENGPVVRHDLVEAIIGGC